MRNLVVMTAALVLWACSSTLAQQVSPTSARSAPVTGMTLPATVPGTIPTVGAGPASALGSINTGALGQISGSIIGRVTACATTAAPSTLFNATTADPISGALPSTPLPGATVPAAPPFGMSTATGACDPTASYQAQIEALGDSTAVSIPGLATITGTTYSDATVPSTATEVGGAGQSPEITVPAPAVPLASPCVGNATIPLTVITDPTTLATTAPPSLFGC